MTKQAIFFLTILCFLVNCKPGIPERLPGIPKKAFWAGENTNGHWFSIDSLNKADKTICFKIYNDKTSKLVSDKKFKLHCYLCDDKINFDNLKDEIRYYDEEKFNGENYIILKTKDADGKFCWFK